MKWIVIGALVLGWLVLWYGQRDEVFTSAHEGHEFTGGEEHE